MQEVQKTYQKPVQLTTRTLDKPLEIEAVIRGAGFVNVKVIPEEAEFVYEDEDEWWETRWTHGARASLERMGPKIIEKCKADLFARMQLLKQPDGFHVLMRAFYVVGLKPDR